jgi:hypothetical protein
MYYENRVFLGQLSADGPALNQALKTQKVLLAAFVLTSAAVLYVSIQYQQQRTLVRKLHERATATG